MVIDYRLYNKDCRAMAEVLDESVHCVVTSPPYWGLRKYAGEQDLVWGGDNHHEHKFGEPFIVRKGHAGTKSTLVGTQTAEITKAANFYGAICKTCGAWRGAYGLEPNLGLYVQHTIEILREIRRVLRKDGVVFWNIGDSYASGKGHCFNPGGGNKSWQSWNDRKGIYNTHRLNKSELDECNLKPKDLCLIPFRVAIAAQEDGWWVRSVIIWNKLNPMPESVRDRPTESHEYILILTKNARYFWDAEAVREPVALSTIGRGSVDFGGSKGRKYKPDKSDPNFRNGSEQWGRTYDYAKASSNGRNLRTVWTFPTVPYPGAHFAVFPERLPELCIKAATPEVGVCTKCGAPWARVLEKQPSQFNIRVRDAKAGRGTPEEGYRATEEEIENYPGNHPDPGYVKTIGWKPTCNCGTEARAPATVLDTFAGAGTTLLSAIKLGRQAIGYELSDEYCDLTRERINQVQMKLIKQ